MKTLLTALLLCLCPCASHSQDAPLPVVRFVQGDTCCKIVWHDGDRTFLIQTASVTVAVSRQSNYSASLHSFVVSIRQDDDTAFDVDPSRFLAVADDAAHTPLPYLDMDTYAAKELKHKKIWNGILLGLAAAGSGAAAGSPQTATVNSSDGSSSTITYTDPNAQARANAQAADNAAASKAKIEAAYNDKLRGLLRRTTTSKGQVVAGVVYFAGPKSMKPTMKGFTPVAGVDIFLNGIIYRFQ